MVNSSFLKEGYTNLCKNRNTYLYKFLDHDRTINELSESIFSLIDDPADNIYDCKQKAIEQGSNIFTFNKGNGACKLSESAGDFSYILVDCGNKDYSYNFFENTDTDFSYNLNGTSINSIPFNGSQPEGIVYFEPSYFRENQDKFKMINYSTSKIQDIIHIYDEIDDIVKDNSANKMNRILEQIQLIRDQMNKLSKYLDMDNDTMKYYDLFDTKSYAFEISSNYFDDLKDRVDLSFNINGGEFKTPINLEQIALENMSVTDDISGTINHDYNGMYDPSFVGSWQPDPVGGADELRDPYTLPFGFTIDFKVSKVEGNDKYDIPASYILSFTLKSVNHDSKGKSKKEITTDFFNEKNRKNKLDSETNLINNQFKRQSLILFLYSLIVFTGLLMIIINIFKPDIIDIKKLFIIFIVLVVIVLFLHYFIEIKNSLNFKQYIDYFKLKYL